MSELSKSDAELAYYHFPDGLRGDVEADAWDYALATTDGETVELLEEAHADADSAFGWEGIYIERRDLDRGRWDLVPLAGIEINDGADEDVYDAAKEFGWNWLDGIRNEVRDLQEATSLSPKQFVAAIVYASRDEEATAHEMDISVGNVRGKIGDVREKAARARKTSRVIEDLGLD